MSQLSHIDLIAAFFLLGLASGAARVPTRLPESVGQFLSIYLLLAIGLKGGQQIAHTTHFHGFASALAIGLGTCLVIPVLVFFLAKKVWSIANAAALAACYGSVSAVTFIVANSILENHGFAVSGYMVAIMALMEAPALMISLAFYERYREKDTSRTKVSILRAGLGHKSIVLICGGFLIGLILDSKNTEALKPVFTDSFKGVLAIYLLDLGASAYNEMHAMRRQLMWSLLFACLLPFAAGTCVLLIAYNAGISIGDTILLAALAGSASYIAAPAAVRVSIPEASPAVYTALPLLLTFTFNMALGIPLYLQIAQFLF